MRFVCIVISSRDKLNAGTNCEWYGTNLHKSTKYAHKCTKCEQIQHKSNKIDSNLPKIYLDH